MNALGEVGKKMRSAIKAKLIELGNGSQTGYIDDELPDYVMIMVANKRSQAQMLNDLSLFLGTNTDNFVSWLHQVLQKLQEVTIPTTTNKKADKSSTNNGGKDKKDKKKDKKKSTSITDVIAAELMEKAKKIDPVIIKKEDKTPPPAPSIRSEPRTPTPPRISTTSETMQKDDDFDIPTISEIATSANSQKLHTKELSQLQELQNRIYQTKNKTHTPSTSEEKEDDQRVESTKSYSVNSQVAGVKATENSKPSNIISLSAIRKAENETLKKFITKQKEENDRRDANRGYSRREVDSRYSRRDRRSRSSSPRDRYHRNSNRARRRSRSRSPTDRKSRSSNIRDRIGSRVIPSISKRSKSPEQKIKRPALSSAIVKNAGKSMLLRAVTEAHKSIVKPSIDSRNKQRDNFTIKIGRNSRNDDDDEYVPEVISNRPKMNSDNNAVYHPTSRKEAMDVDDDNVLFLNNNDVDLDDLEVDNENTSCQSPKFIVSLDGLANSRYNERDSSKSPTPPPVIKRIQRKSIKDRIGVRPIEQLMRPQKRKNNEMQIDEEGGNSRERGDEEEECESQRAYNKVKRTRVSPIKFDLTDDENEDRKSRGSSYDKKTPTKADQLNNRENGEERDKRIRLEPSRNFDHVPALLSSVAVPIPDSAKPIVKSKERCKYYPACTNTSCQFFHPSSQCKLFPMCKFGDSCSFIHPKCKFDISCNRIDCNFTHTPLVAQNTPVVASSIVPVQNYKSIQITPSTTICKFFPACTNTNCTFLHPKVCKFGKACMNKFDCNFYHFETSSKNKFKWVSQQF